MPQPTATPRNPHVRVYITKDPLLPDMMDIKGPEKPTNCSPFPRKVFLMFLQ
jgi:hypothetical protein